MTFETVLSSCGGQGVIAVAAAQDKEVLEAVSLAMQDGCNSPILVGDAEQIQRIAEQIGFDVAKCRIVSAPDVLTAAKTAVGIVREGGASALMKGILQTADLLRAVLNKENGLRTGNLLSHVGIVELHDERLIMMSDGAMVMYPDLTQKVQIINNAVAFARALGYECPNVAVIGAVELVNPDMPCTLDASVLTQMNRRNQIKNCIVDGPLALDVALDAQAAKHKGVQSPVAGCADILVMPNIETGNVFYKTCVYVGGCKSAGLVMGAKVPIILTSRSDSANTKRLSIRIAGRM